MIENTRAHQPELSRQEMWLNVEIVTTSLSTVRSMWQVDLSAEDVARVNAENAEEVARKYLAEFQAKTRVVEPFDWYRITITDQWDGEIVYLVSFAAPEKKP